MATRYKIIHTGKKAAGTDITTGTDDEKYVTSKALSDAGLKLDTDATLSADSDAKIASQKAVKSYVDNNSGSLLFMQVFN